MKLFPVSVALLACPALAAEPLEFRGNVTWRNAVTYNRVDELAAGNTDNAVARVPYAAFYSDVKPELKVVSPQITAIARPRVRMKYEAVKVGKDKEDPRGSSEGDVREAFVQWTLSDAATLVYGLQNFSWGGTEALTPSNRLFHETAEARNLLYDVRGKNLARLNLSAGRAWSLVLMTEFKENEDETPFAYGQKFESATAVKGEFNWNGGSDFFGIVGGGREHGRTWVGEYLNVAIPFIEGLSLVGDAAQERGSEAYYPVEQMTAGGPVTTLEQTDKDERKVRTLAVAGLRYDFENGATIRTEYVGNDAGYDKEQTEAFYKALRPATPAQGAALEQNLTRSAARGLELPGRRYGYLSATWPKAFDNNDLTLFARTLVSLTDKSSSSYGSLEYALGDSGVIFYGAAVAGGKRDTELRGLTTTTQTAGYRHTW